MWFSFLYEIGISFLLGIYNIYALFNNDAKTFLIERRSVAGSSSKLEKDKQLVWMHCASHGEFEQGKPVIKALKKKYPELQILVSFFSPSGYSQIKAGGFIDEVCYLPFDKRKNAKNFVEKYRPDIAIFVKYEFWYNFVRVLNEKSIPGFFVSVSLNEDHHIFKSIFKPLLNELRKLTQIFTQNESTQELLEKHHFSNVSHAGDTRIDTVLELTTKEFHDKKIDQFTKTDKKIIVIGSSWSKDITLFEKMGPGFLEKYKWIIVPHKINEQNIHEIEDVFESMRNGRYSSYNTASELDVLIIDQIGLLKYLYRHAWIVYIGGGFGVGIHNTLEPAAYGKQVITGPNYKKFLEAVELVGMRLFHAVSSPTELKNAIIKIEEDEDYEGKASEIMNYLNQNKNSTSKILAKMERFWHENV